MRPHPPALRASGRHSSRMRRDRNRGAASAGRAMTEAPRLAAPRSAGRGARRCRRSPSPAAAWRRRCWRCPSTARRRRCVGLGVYALVAARGARPAAARRTRTPASALANGITLVRAGGAAVFAALAAAPGLVAGAARLGRVRGARRRCSRSTGSTAGWRGGRGSPRRSARASTWRSTRSRSSRSPPSPRAPARRAPGCSALGLMRYAFVAAGWRWPALARPLPPSLRRKAVCVLQVGGARR